MTPYKEIGECVISAGEDDYFFRPSFSAMRRIGEPQEIVQAFHDLHSTSLGPLIDRAIDACGTVPKWLIEYAKSPQMCKPALLAAMSVLTACCERDVSSLIGEIIPGKSGKWAFVWRKGPMPATDMIIVAQSLIVHGIIGKAKIRQLQRHESNQATTGFDAFEYISAARNHFGMTRADAEQLTMTEFQLLLAAKYPEQKGFTREEYDATADDYFAKKARRLSKAA